MNNSTARCLVNAFACNASIEAMKAENAFRERNGQAIAYGEDAFNIEAGNLELLAREIADWSHLP